MASPEKHSPLHALLHIEVPPQSVISTVSLLLGAERTAVIP